MMIRSALTWLEKNGISLHRVRFTAEPALNVLELLLEREAERVGTVIIVQVGANDGQSNDPLINFFTRFDADAILIEPLPDAFRRLCMLHHENHRITCVNAAVTAVDGNTEMWKLETELPCPEASRVSSFSRAHVKRHMKFFRASKPRIVRQTVTALTPATILKEYKIERITLLQVDAEGYDFEVIDLFLRAGLRPKIINFESRHLRKNVQKCRSMLDGAGYVFSNSGFDTVAYHIGSNS